jgi:hypothetical protein
MKKAASAMTFTYKYSTLVIMTLGLCVFTLPAWAVDATSCAYEDRACVIDAVEATAAAIENQSWRDQTYRELAKTLAADNNLDRALGLIEKIITPDTKAMTIRGIGMAVAEQKLPEADRQIAFTKLREAAETIKDPPSYAIALTYIAMAQAFAGDNDGAWATAASMKNDALRHKAYAETAEIQAEAGNFNAAMRSIELINSQSFQNKALLSVTKILSDHEYYNEALKAAAEITNPYEKTTALQYVLDSQKPREIERP